MGRRKALSDDACLRRFLLTVRHHPWATPNLNQAYAGLPTRVPDGTKPGPGTRLG